MQLLTSLALVAFGIGPVAELAPIVQPAKLTPAGKANVAMVTSLDWLARHQSEDGSWSAIEFGEVCAEEKQPCLGTGEAGYDVGLTGLALLAFTRSGKYVHKYKHELVVEKAADFLIAQVDSKTGLIGGRDNTSFMYNHTIALLALCEVQEMEPSDKVLGACKSGFKFLRRGHNPYSGWRYDEPPEGDSDVSVTGWALQAILAGGRIGLELDEAMFDGGQLFINEVLATDTGRFGYTEAGSFSSRLNGKNDQYSTKMGEAMTGIALKFALTGAKNKKEMVKTMERSINLLMAKMPAWPEDGGTVDMYYWMHATEAMALVDGSPWTKWKRAMVKALDQGRVAKGHGKGSWEPIGVWSYCGGRVYSTACMAIATSYCL